MAIGVLPVNATFQETDMVKSKFQQWFEKQFGTRARRFKTLSDFQLQEKVEGCRSDLEEAVEEQQRRTRWDAQFQAALYAKQASPDFKF